MDSLKHLINKFNDGNYDILKYFGDYKNWFNVLQSRDLLDEIDPEGERSEEWQNEYILWLYENNKEKYYQFMKENLGDIRIENNKVYWVGDRSTLGSLFCDSRDISQSTIENFLGGEDIFEPFWETTDDVYRDVIEELDEKNIQGLKEYIIKNLQGKQISPETEEMEVIASEQGHPEYWEINTDNVSRIIDDEESMNSLLDDELSELKSELYSIHNWSYNSAYESEFYKRVMSALNNFFEGNGEWINIPHPYKKDTMVEKFKIPILDFEGVINTFLYDNRNYGTNGTLDHYGSFVDALRESQDCLSLHMSDYPDFREVDKNINIYFTDHI